MNINRINGGYNINNANTINKNSTPSFKALKIMNVEIPIDEALEENLAVVNYIRDKKTNEVILNKRLFPTEEVKDKVSSVLAEFSMGFNKRAEGINGEMLQGLQVQTDLFNGVVNQAKESMTSVTAQSQETIENISKQAKESIESVVQQAKEATDGLSQKLAETATQQQAGSFFQNIKGAVSKMSTGGKVGLAIGAVAVAASCVYGIYSLCKNIKVKNAKKADVKPAVQQTTTKNEVKPQTTAKSSTFTPKQTKSNVFSQFA